MAKILVGFNTIDEGFERLCAQHTVIRPQTNKDLRTEELMELIEDCDILCSTITHAVTGELMARGKKLKLVANYAVGYNNIDIDYARVHGIAVTNTPRSVVAPTAELAMALLLSCTRRTAELDRRIREVGGKLRLPRLEMLGTNLYGKTIGIVGYGNIGAAVAKRCLAFGLRVLYYKRTRLAPELEAAQQIEYRPLEDLLRESDIVSLHTPYTLASHHQIGERELALMKQGSILINTARGSIVDEDALIAALKSGHLATAGLDVFEDKDVPRPGLLELPQVVMTPHVGTKTYEAWRSMVDELVDNVLGFLDGSPNISRIV